MTTNSPIQLMRDEIPHFFETIPGFFWFEETYRRIIETLPTDRLCEWVEIGCFQGRSTAWLGVEAIRRRIPLVLHAVDSFEGIEIAGHTAGATLEARFRANIEPLAPQLEALGGRLEVWPMRSLAAVGRFADESLDVVWVDGAHDYDSVKADILAWWPKLRAGGFMGGDDWMMESVQRAVVEQFAPSGYILCHGWSDEIYRNGSRTPESGPWPSWLARKA